ncbi:MAG: ribosome biogenesis GTP-binding protein YihA/YsxC [Peptoniphilaceae bacterium]|nr:ribosome biogenesis GTP-binding protein YihA/YsxC [Peptoniphilaceae bacterium]MDY6085715.1 ribosome biogenesis GTP-binding protein YihA/YsxC [Peptoniphilaceae bacterium]
MKILEASLEAMAVHSDQYPPEDVPEFAFAGRSNVGKSTFINTFAGRKNLAYTSASPGKTRTVNFYTVRVEDHERRSTFRLVDLPGYGFAQASKRAQDDWAKSINRYLQTRQTLQEVFLLCDLRHDPTAQDRQMFRWIVESGFSGYVIATKADKVPRSKREAQKKAIARVLGANPAQVYPMAGRAATKIEGMEPIMKLFGALIAPEASDGPAKSSCT